MGKSQTCAGVKNTVRLEKCLCKSTAPRVQWNSQFAKVTSYNGKVLLGNWFEDTCKYQKNKYNHDSEYLSEYGLKPNTTLPRSVIWDATIAAQGSDVVSGNDLDKSNASYMTSYYLSYELLPVLAKQTCENQSIHSKQNRNKQLLNYGNQDNYGLVEDKKSVWQCEKNDPRSTAETLCETTYIEPAKEAYKFHRWSRLKAVKGKYGDEYPPLPPFHPRLARCNPLTWECREMINRPT